MTTRTEAVIAIRGELDLSMKLRSYEVLETARRTLCSYLRDPCDCKYGASPSTNPYSEQNGCPELRDLIFNTTGFVPYNHGQSVADDLVEFTKRSEEIRASYLAAGSPPISIERVER